jgi:hypothetical protein
MLLLMLAMSGGLYLKYQADRPVDPRMAEAETKLKEAENRAKEAEAREEAAKKEAQAQKERAEKFGKFVENLEHTNRVAELVVHDPTYAKDSEGNYLLDTQGNRKILSEWITFSELDDHGKELNFKDIWIDGNVAHLDTQVVVFDNDSIKNGDRLKGHGLVLFRSLYDEKTTPEIAHSPDNSINKLDREGEIPGFYNSADPDIVAFQKKLWHEFPDISRNPEKAKEMGIHVAQGQEVYREFDPSFKYTVTIDATGEVKILLTRRSPGEIRALERHEQLGGPNGVGKPATTPSAGHSPEAGTANNPSATR